MKSYRKIDPLWRLVQPLTVEQAASLIAGEEPSSVMFVNDEATYFSDPESGITESEGISRVNTAYKALKSAISNGELEADLFYESRSLNEADFQALIAQVELSGYSKPNPDFLAEDDETHEDGFFVKKNPNWAKTTVKFDDVVAWLTSRGVTDGFFFPVEEAPRDYLDPNHPRYSVRLAAAIKVWEAMGDENLLAGKATKTAIKDWLESRYKELGLVHKNKISNNAIENVVAVVNWQTVGGAPKTPA